MWNGEVAAVKWTQDQYSGKKTKDEVPGRDFVANGLRVQCIKHVKRSER